MTSPDAAPLDFQVNRDDLRECRFVPGAPVGALAHGQVLMRVDRFAFTSNNVSYAVAGDLLDYWGFFPGVERWGRIPAMGFGDVVASRNPGVAEGARCFGFFPMSRHLVVDAQPNASGFVDGAAHRRGHAPAYRAYALTTADPMYTEAHEDRILLLRGLFMTSFLVDDFLGDGDFFGARTSIVTSASSKTSIALAFQLAARGRGPVVGLTSPRNVGFVEALGLYDRVLPYEAVSTLSADEPCVVVDMAGDGDVMNAVHGHYGENLKYSCIVGATHWESKPRSEDLPGAKPEFFFAPAQIEKRSREWGPGGLQQRLGDAWGRFVASSEGWLRVVRGQGPEAVERVYLDLLGGRTAPSEGHVVSLWEA